MTLSDLACRRSTPCLATGLSGWFVIGAGVFLLILAFAGWALWNRREAQRRGSRYEFDDYGRLKTIVPPYKEQGGIR